MLEAFWEFGFKLVEFVWLEGTYVSSLCVCVVFESVLDM